MAKTLVATGNIKAICVREAAVLALDYVAEEPCLIQGANQLQVFVGFVKGRSDGCRLKIEFSEDKENWYQESVADLVGGDNVHSPLARKLDDSCNLLISMPVSATWFRISAQAITAVSGSSLSVMATIANI